VVKVGRSGTFRVKIIKVEVKTLLLYVLYMAELAKVVARYGLQMHQYVGDIQIYIYTTIDYAASAVDRFSAFDRC